MGFDTKIPVLQLANIFNVFGLSGHSDRHTANKYSNNHASSVGIVAERVTGVDSRQEQMIFVFPAVPTLGAPSVFLFGGCRGL